MAMVDSGFGLLSELTKNNSKISQLLLDSDGLELITKAMAYHSSSSHVQVRACEVLFNLPIGVSAVHGAAELILKAMKNALLLSFSCNCRDAVIGRSRSMTISFYPMKVLCSSS